METIELKMVLKKKLFSKSKVEAFTFKKIKVIQITIVSTRIRH